MNCEEIKQLLYYYIYDEINNPDLDEYISMHLEECDDCYEYYEDLIDKIQENNNLENISAYIDNELSSKEGLQIKKNIISNKNVRKEYENMLSLKNNIKNLFTRQENIQKDDYSKIIFKELNLMEKVYGRNVFAEIAGIFIVIFIGLFIATFAIFAI